VPVEGLKVGGGGVDKRSNRGVGGNMGERIHNAS